MKLTGIPSSPGKARGTIRRLEGHGTSRTGPEPAHAVSWDEAVETAKLYLEGARTRAVSSAGPEIAEIFEAQMMIAEDPTLREAAMELSGSMPAARAAREAAETLAAKFDSVEDEYIRARGADIRHVGELIAQALSGDTGTGPSVASSGDRARDQIIAAPDISPSQAVFLNEEGICGIALESGTVNSHASILARSMGIPCLVSVKGLMAEAVDGAECILDADGGELTSGDDMPEGLPPSSAPSAPMRYVSELRSRDGCAIGLALNIGSPADLERASAYGLAGIDVGLMRTEFMFMGSDEPPGVSEQVEAYRRIAEAAAPGRVRFRTLDIGGDKKPPFVDIRQEENPYLGLRSIRHSLANRGIFVDQLKALAQVSRDYPIDVMFPMVTVAEELREAKGLLSLALEEAGKVKGGARVGAMIEVPSACMMADRMAEECDFLSIGTNDLVQYAMAADRGNPDVAGLYQQLNPAILRLIEMCVAACARAGKELSACGELAGTPEGAVLLAGLGVGKLSMSPANTGRVAGALGLLSMKEMRELVELSLRASTQEEVLGLISSALQIDS